MNRHGRSLHERDRRTHRPVDVDELDVPVGARDADPAGHRQVARRRDADAVDAPPARRGDRPPLARCAIGSRERRRPRDARDEVDAVMQHHLFAVHARLEL